MRQVFFFATFLLNRLNPVPALRAVGVDLYPLHQTDLVVEVPAARIHEMVVLHLLVQTYGALVLGLALLDHILELVIFVLVLAGLRVYVGAGVGLYEVHHVELPLPLLQDPLLHLEATQAEQVVPPADVCLD